MKKDATDQAQPPTATAPARPATGLNQAFPKATKDQVQLMVAQGIPYPQISTATGVAIGTIKCWCHKHQWQAARKATTTALQARADLANAQQWLARAATWRERMATLAEARIADITKHASSLTPRNLEGWLRSLDLLDKIGRRQFGLDAPNATATVSIITTGSVLVGEQPQPDDASDGAIDV